MKDTAVWFRVSGDDQRADNQVPEVGRFCQHHDLHVVRKFTVSDTAWKNGGGPEYKAELAKALEAAWRGEFKVLVVWAIDRISRNGAEDLLPLIRQFRERGMVLVSVQESWLNGWRHDHDHVLVQIRPTSLVSQSAVPVRVSQA